MAQFKFEKATNFIYSQSSSGNVMLLPYSFKIRELENEITKLQKTFEKQSQGTGAQLPDVSPFYVDHLYHSPPDWVNPVRL